MNQATAQAPALAKEVVGQFGNRLAYEDIQWEILEDRMFARLGRTRLWLEDGALFACTQVGPTLCFGQVVKGRVPEPMKLALADPRWN
jgi:hypothetical protein